MPTSSLLNHKLDQSRMVLQEAFDSFAPEQMIIAWSGGKDSTLLVRLAIEVCQDLNLAMPRVLDIDQGDAFEEIITFRDRLVEMWQLDLVVVRNDDVLDRVSKIGDPIIVQDLAPGNRQALADTGHTAATMPWIPSSFECNHLMKSVPVADFIARHDIKAMMTGIRWDEHPSRSGESYFSSRTNPEHTRIHPMLHLSERDIWEATFSLEVPFNALYELGYRSLDTRTGCRLTDSRPAWIQALSDSPERHGRDTDKEKIMTQLRALGYM